jgi:hypothetical protein
MEIPPAIESQIKLDFLVMINARSSCCGVPHKRYSKEQELAPEKTLKLSILLLIFALNKIES